MGKDDRIELRICGSESCPDSKYNIFYHFTRGRGLVSILEPAILRKNSTAQCSVSLIGGVCKPQFQSLCTQNLFVSSTREWYNLGKIMERHLHRAGVHRGAQGCTGVHGCTFSTTFLFVKLESWNLVWMLEFKFHQLSFKPYFEKNRCAVVHRGAQGCTGCTKCTFSPTFLFVKLESWNLV